MDADSSKSSVFLRLASGATSFVSGDEVLSVPGNVAGRSELLTDLLEQYADRDVELPMPLELAELSAWLLFAQRHDSASGSPDVSGTQENGSGDKEDAFTCIRALKVCRMTIAIFAVPLLYSIHVDLARSCKRFCTHFSLMRPHTTAGLPAAPT